MQVQKKITDSFQTCYCNFMNEAITNLIAFWFGCVIQLCLMWIFISQCCLYSTYVVKRMIWTRPHWLALSLVSFSNSTTASIVIVTQCNAIVMFYVHEHHNSWWNKVLFCDHLNVGVCFVKFCIWVLSNTAGWCHSA